MKTISKIFGVAAFACAFVCSCAKVETTPVREPSPVVDDSMVSAYFATKGDTKVTLDPGVATPYQIPVALDKPAEAETTVKLIVKQNTSDVFTVPETLTFGVGEQTANLDVAFDGSKTEKGITYTLEIVIDESGYNPYKQFDGAVGYLGNFLFEKWNLIGTGVFSDDFEGVENYPMSLYQLDGEDTYEIREWPYLQLFEYYLGKYGGEWADWEAQMKEASAEKIRFSLKTVDGDDNVYLVYEPWNCEWYTTGVILQAFLPSSYSSSYAAYDSYSKLLNSGNVIRFYPIYGMTGVGAYGFYQAKFILDNGVTIPVK